MTKEEQDKQDSEDEEPELEDIIEESSEESQDIPNNDFVFQQFIQPSQTGAPVLDTVEGVQGQPQFIRLEQDVGSTPNSSNNKDDPFSYATNPEEQEQQKYTDTSNIGQGPQRVDITQVGRERLNQPQEAGFIQSNELKGIESDTSMKYIESEKIDPTTAGRQDPFKSNLREAETKKSDYTIK